MGHGTAIGTALRGDISKLRRCRAPSLRSLGRTPRDEMIAAHCDACSWACSNTIRTTRSRTFGKNLLGLAMPHPLKEWSRILQLATGLVTLRLAKRQRGQLPPLRRNPYTVSRGLFLLQAPVQVTHSEHPQSEKTQRCGFGNGLENVRTNRVIAAKADDVARLGDASDRLALGEGANSIRIPRSSSVSGEVAVCPDICRGKQRVPVGIESKEVAVELARPKPARRQVDTLVALRGSVLSCRGNAGADVVSGVAIATGTIHELREKNEIGVEWLSIARVSLLVQTPRGIEACGEVSTGVRLSDILPVEVNFATGCATASRRIDGCPVKDTGDLRAAGSSAGEYASSATLNIAAWRVLGRAFHDARDLENAPVALTRDGSCCGVGAVD